MKVCGSLNKISDVTKWNPTHATVDNWKLIGRSLHTILHQTTEGCGVGIVQILSYAKQLLFDCHRSSQSVSRWGILSEKQNELDDFNATVPAKPPP
ncbi:hypothetical protein T4B_12778 [Trichinella pseudospiralis]|uniref:Uncharacterized protein n=2 Tax=Trichinella pseudospiralis TaxID=6337 RepID=A0A0V1FQR6_TRIPS|nr:hypothetical protein T4D_11799 [Trichinella pseudospiralis]KRZ22315.1 hypothetical protein T4B_12778 [Trichinella pseudospiralis]KRZ29077.1 hypothetical protein T4C_10450 [Trichinella pseudospiralis]